MDSGVCLVQRSELRAVFVINPEGEPRLRQIRPGVRDGQRLEVLSGSVPVNRW